MKEKILEIAREQYLEQGEKGLSMRNIAKTAGVTPMALYRYFEDKEDLQKQLLTSAFELFGSYLQASLEGDTAEKRLMLSANAFLSFALEQTKYFELMFLSVDPLNSIKAQKVIKNKSLPTFRFLQDRVRDCIDEDYFLNDDSEEIAICLLSHCTGFAALHISGTFNWTDDEIREKYLNSFKRIIAGFIATRP